MTGKQHLRHGFSLVELLVVIGILGLLAALLLPAIQQSRLAAVRTTCQNQLRQIALAMHNYQSQYSVYPPGGVHTTTNTPGTVPGGNQPIDELLDGRAPWSVLILPQLDEGNRYNSFNVNDVFAARADLIGETQEPNLTQQFLRLAKYSCPSNPNSSFAGLFSSYAACQGGGTKEDAAEISKNANPRLFYSNGIFYTNSSVKPEDITDGMSNTIMIGETKYIGTPESFKTTNAWWPWAASIRSGPFPALFNISATVDPINFPQNGSYTEQEIVSHKAVYQGCVHAGQQQVFGSWHKGGGNFAMADGTVHFLSENMDLTTYRRLGQKADGGSSSF